MDIDAIPHPEDRDAAGKGKRVKLRQTTLPADLADIQKRILADHPLVQFLFLRNSRRASTVAYTKPYSPPCPCGDSLSALAVDFLRTASAVFPKFLRAT